MNNNSNNLNTTINISKVHYKQLKTLSKRFGVSNLQFINAAVNFLRTSGVNPLDKNIGAAEQFKRLEKRNDEILRFFRVFESQKLQPILDNLIITQRMLDEKTSDIPTCKDIKDIEANMNRDFKNGVEYIHKGQASNHNYLKKIDKILNDILQKQEQHQKLIENLFSTINKSDNRENINQSLFNRF
nr:BfmA/BtgA family mobilization protein [uncultured Carboxylicivirga sp.]